MEAKVELVQHHRDVVATQVTTVHENKRRLPRRKKVDRALFIQAFDPTVKLYDGPHLKLSHIILLCILTSWPKNSTPY